MKNYVAFVLALFFAIQVGWADVRLPGIFGNHMVLQRNTPIHIWGWASPGETVKISLNGKSKQTQAGEDGKWSLNLNKEKAGGPYSLVVNGDNEIVLNDILIGDIWVCSGQSNMEWTLKKTDNAAAEIASANLPRIRHIKIPKTVAGSPKDDISGNPEWQQATPQHVVEFTAVGYYFAKELQEELNVPIGLLNSSWGGTNVETWTSREAFENSEEFRAMINTVANPIPDSTVKKNKPNIAPSLLFNSMIEPIIPFKIKGVIWYQGESNASLAHQYQTAFPLLINDWRGRWDIGNFPFYFVQLASFKASGGTSEKGSTWAELREAQAMTLSLPNTGMAVTTDIGNSNDIHPTNKLDVGKRLAAIALNKTYKKKNEYSGPVFKKMKRDGNNVKIYFDHVDGGLTSKNAVDALKGFEIAGAGRSFKKADARIEKNYIVVSSDEVTDPAAVRYGWSDDNIEINLFNKAGFPASPFRTDSWEGITVGAKRTYL